MTLLFKKRHLPLKTLYYLVFFFCIVKPELIVLLAALLILNQQYKKQAIENIERSQDAVISDLQSDLDIMSMRLSHMIFTNNNEVLAFAAAADDENYTVRYDSEQKLLDSVNLVLEPVKEIVSVSFYMKDGRDTYIKNNITRSRQEIERTSWYQKALKNTNTVYIGSYNTAGINDLYMGSKKNTLVLVFALGPDLQTDRTQKVEMVMFFQSASAGELINDYNREYLAGKNKLGMMRIRTEDGKAIFQTEKEDYAKKYYTCVSSRLRVGDEDWVVESNIRTSELTSDFWKTAGFVLCAALVVLLMAAYFSRYFLRGIIKPVGAISSGLHEIEEGNMDVHITPTGQYEVRNMIHQFNAMVRRLKALIVEYEEKVHSMEMQPEEYLELLLKGETEAEKVNQLSPEFFAESYLLMRLNVEKTGSQELKEHMLYDLKKNFERNPRFASRCTMARESISVIWVMYRIMEEEYAEKAVTMVKELQKSAARELNLSFTVCIGRQVRDCETFGESVQEIRNTQCLHRLRGKHAVIDLNQRYERMEEIVEGSKTYQRLAEALYIADEMIVNREKEKLFTDFVTLTKEEAIHRTFAVILAIANRFDQDEGGFADVFGEQYDYVEKLRRLEDIRSLRIWLTNYFTWINDYSAVKLDELKLDVVAKAKRYMKDNYESSELSLVKVAQYVDLNEKYFTNRFTKETGDTFSNYLTQIRLEKSKELLRTTNFKIYEIAAMVGYNSAEHYTRMFKKVVGLSPAQYRKED